MAKLQANQRSLLPSYYCAFLCYSSSSAVEEESNASEYKFALVLPNISFCVLWNRPDLQQEWINITTFIELFFLFRRFQL